MTFVVDSRPARRRADIPRLPSLTNSDGTATSSSKSSPSQSTDASGVLERTHPLTSIDNRSSMPPSDAGDVKFPSAPFSSRPTSLAFDTQGPPRPRLSSRPLSPSVDGERRSRTWSRPLSYMPRFSLTSTLLHHTRIWFAVMRDLTPADFLSLIRVNRQMRRTFFDPKLRDIILSQYLPGFTFALRVSDTIRFEDNIRITAGDFEHLLASQNIPLHQYPMHALTVLSAFIPTHQMDATTERLAILTQAHSRFALYLQSLVHSSNVPPTLDEQEARWRPQESSLRELRFPAPLSYFSQAPAQVQASTSATSVATQSEKSSKKTKHRQYSSMSTLGRASSSGSPDKSPNRPSLISSGKPSRKSSRLSVFGIGASIPKTPLPPIMDEPKSLKEFSTWRRAPMPVLLGSKSSSYDDLDTRVAGLQPPSQSRFVSSGRHSSDSSLDEAATYHPRVNRTPESDPSGTSSNSFSQWGPQLSSPHDLAAATSRSRAPIIRVFIPCSELSQSVIDACEMQLRHSGLWQHLHGGDIVCNLGFVPESDDSPAGTQIALSRPPSAPASQTHHDIPERDKRTWLIFDGLRLSTIVPPAPPPLRNALSLPSPFYYSHLLPAYANPRYVLTLPPYADALQLTLVNLWTHVPSPGASGGYVRVKKYMWLGKLQAEPFPGMGTAWQGEWILEGEGTKEGRQSLVDALAGDESGERLWEVVRQKSGGGRLWLKLLTTAPP